ncbi:hypothetical protein FHW36_113111 [Chitinophaga polysaccharea]|uniref:PH (Pleckstrin Homology) domain-containing protein n=2 Tax=Chitinophaga polysaccharea TaxID=1293035 RepID=A0A561P414_9BACT|nr:hypothetical protein FHW36_113111 [Chitinophaga polysaccharea]
MRKEPLDKLSGYIEREDISSPKFKFDENGLSISSPVFNYNSITTLVLLPLIIFLMQKANFFIGLLLLGIALFSLWYEFESVNDFEINFDNNCSIIKRRNPITRLFFFINQEVRFAVANIAGFSYRSTQQKPSFRRYRLYVTLENGDEFLFSDIGSETRANEIVLLLNNVFK